MKLREQASLGCKILALFTVIIAMNSLLQGIALVAGVPGLSAPNIGRPLWQNLLYSSAPATMMFLFSAALWGISPFLATVMIPDATAEKIDAEVPTTVSVFSLSAREALRIALVTLSLYLLANGATATGYIVVLRSTVAAIPVAHTKSIAPFYLFQMNVQIMNAALYLILGILFLLLSAPISRRAFPD